MFASVAALAKANALAVLSANRQAMTKIWALRAFFALSAPFFAQNSFTQQKLERKSNKYLLAKNIVAQAVLEKDASNFLADSNSKESAPIKNLLVNDLATKDTPKNATTEKDTNATQKEATAQNPQKAVTLIKEISTTDAAFKKLSALIEESDKAFYKNNRKRQIQRKKESNPNAPELAADPSPIELFSYKCKAGDTLLSLSAALNLPYDTIATINNISAMNTKLVGRELLLPSAKGLFIPTKAKSDLDILLYKEYIEGKTAPLPLDIKGLQYLFLQGLRFSSTQRAFFMDKGFRLPLDTKVISSEFGGRMSPVYNRWKDHKGIDFAAPTGDKVYACKGGTVAYVFLNDKIFGNYIILSHDNNMTSVYAHLSKVLIKQGQTVSAGTVLGLVGATGAATGPHLHFELRLAGDAKNPRDYLKL